MSPQALPSKALRALVMARSMSSLVEFGILAITSPVAGLRTSSISPRPASISPPSTKLPWISTSMDLVGLFMTSPFDDHGVTLQRRQHALLGGADMRLDDARGRAAVALLHRLDQRHMFGHQLLRIMSPEIGDADPHQPVGLPDQVAQRSRHAAIAGGVRERGVEAAVIGDEVFMIAGEAAELVQRLQSGIAGVLDRLGHAGRLQREPEAQEVARIRQRDRI